MYKRFKVDRPNKVFITVHKEEDVYLYHVQTRRQSVLRSVGPVIDTSDGFLILDSDKARVSQVLSAHMPAVEQDWPSREVEALIRSVVDLSYDGSSCPEGIPSSTWESAYNYQKEAVFRSLYEFSGRVLLSMEMGLGKSITSSMIISHWEHIHPGGVHIVITPSGLKDNMFKEIERWSCFDADKLQCIKTGKQVIRDGVKVIMMSYAIATSRITEIKKMNVTSVIVDESQMLKSIVSKRSKVLTPYLAQIPRLLLLSGSPVPNCFIEILPTLRMLHPKVFRNTSGSYYRFADRYGGGKMNQYNHYECRGSTNSHELHLIATKSMIRLRKEDVDLKLPDFERHMVKLPLSDESRSILRSGLAKLNVQKTDVDDDEWTLQRKKSRAMKYFADLMKVTMRAKMSPTIDYLDRFFDRSETRSIVYAFNMDMMNAICELLDRKGVGHIRIDGSTLPNKRQRMIDDFISDNSCKCAVLSLGSCSEGLTILAKDESLIPIDTMVFTQLSFVPTQLMQAEARIHRTGSRYPVKYEYLVLDRSFECIMWDVLEKKTGNISSVLDDEMKNIDVESIILDQMDNQY